MSDDPPLPPPRETHGPVSSLGVQMLLIGTLCLALALVRQAPGLAVPLLFFTVLGWLRNRTIMRRRREQRLASTSWDYFNAFLVSWLEMAFLFCGTVVIFLLTALGVGPIFIKEVNPFGVLLTFATAVVVSGFFVAWILKGRRLSLNRSGKMSPYGHDWNRARFPRSTTSFSKFDPATTTNAEPTRGRPASVALDDDSSAEGEAVDEDDDQEDIAAQPRRDSTHQPRHELGPDAAGQTW